MSRLKNQFRYVNIFMYGSLQSVGHTEEYFAKHTEKLLVFIVMPRVQNRNNLLRIYSRGRRIEEFSVWSSGNFVLYYVSWLLHYWKFVLTYFERSEHFLVFSGHPISFFGMTIQKLLRPGIGFAYWIGDYYPPVSWSLRWFERIKKHYHDRIGITYYLSDPINQIMNGTVVQQKNKRTVMWGVKPPSRVNKKIRGALSLLFVGVIRPSQGLEDIFSYLSHSRDVRVRVVGVCEPTLYTSYANLIHELGIGSRVDFPNTFVSDEKLKLLAKEYHVGLALYDTGLQTATHYTDPGKVKTYAELGLPIVMTNTSAIAPYIERFHAGEVAPSVSQLPAALDKIKRHYRRYQKGLLAFSRHFDYEKYYERAFMALAARG